MPRYLFNCDCGEIQEFINPFSEGPPKKVTCKCGQKMYQEFSCHFILKGEWPGKTISREREGTLTADKADEFHDTIDKAESTQKEVLSERRKGTDSFAKYSKRNPSKVRKYWQNKGRYGTGNKDSRQPDNWSP